MPAISVIVPVYKVEPYLSRCVDSILAQTFTDFELILVNDGSPDNCGKICDEYAEKDSRTHVIHRDNGGLSAARNSGIDWVFEHSNSQWITFIDSDDWVHPQYLELMLSTATDNNTDIAVCDYTETAEFYDFKNISKINVQRLTPEDFFVQHHVTAVIACCKLYKKDCFKYIRYPVGKLHEDEFTTYKILFENTRISYLNEKLYFYYTNPHSIVRSEWSPKRLDAITAFEEQIEYFRKKKFDKAYKKAVFKLLWYLVSQLENASKSTEYKSIHNKLKQDLKKQLKKYENEFNLSVSKNSGFYEAVYPKRVKLYWLVTGIINKIKKVFLCHKSA